MALELGISVSKPNLAGPILLLGGPTAVGKSEVALLLAEQLGGEIVSVDSMQVYRGMDIGTGKPSKAERERAPHHLLDVAEVTAPFDAAQFVVLASAAIADVQARGRLPILCGGTGLYFKALLEGLSEAPSADERLRAELAATPLPELLSELAQRDPVTYARVDRQNLRRVVRALEVIRLTGRAFSDRQVNWQPVKDHPGTDLPFFGLSRKPEDLNRRIEARVDEMFRQGLVAETSELLKAGLAGNKTASQALGYWQAADYLRGERTLSETVALVKARTRKYAKRQMTWFRTQLQLRWFAIEPGQSLAATAQELATAFARWPEKLEPSA